MLQRVRERLRDFEPVRHLGTVRSASATSVVADGPDVALGETCLLSPAAVQPCAVEGVLSGRSSRDCGASLLCEVVSLHRGAVTLMPVDAAGTQGVAAGWRVSALGRTASVPFGNRLLGRVIDASGRPLDGGPSLRDLPRRELAARAVEALQRPRIDTVLETGVRAIDALLTLGRGQRVGVFAGSGVGKSRLLGAITRQARVDVNVVALIGERGREVREFIEKQLDVAARQRSVVVVASSDQPALARIRAAQAAVSIAEGFREEGRHVLLTMDSVTRFAMARREVGLAAGEPPTSRGYTPSVFAELPVLCERCGTAPGGGSITALFAVLVEGDDLSEPVADHMRSVLDGHLVLSRALSQRGHFPPIDVTSSTSRLLGDLADDAARRLALRTRRTLDLLERNRQAVELGAYVAGSHAELDDALRVEPALISFLQQDEIPVARSAALDELEALMSAGRRP